MGAKKRWFDSGEKKAAKAQAKELGTPVWKVVFTKPRKGEKLVRLYVGENVPRTTIYGAEFESNKI